MLAQLAIIPVGFLSELPHWSQILKFLKKFCFFVFGLSICSSLSRGAQDPEAVHRAMINLTQTASSGALLPLVFTPKVFDELWRSWDPNEIAQTRIALKTQLEKRKAVFEHYGLLENPKNSLLPLGFVTRNGLLAMNCLACHAGQIQGQIIIGLPNRNIDLKSLLHDLAKMHPIPGMFFNQLALNFGPERGMVVSPGIESMALNLRDANMNLQMSPNNLGSFEKSVVNVPPWWNLPLKTHIFADAVLPVTPRIFVPNMTSAMDIGIFFKAAEPSVSDAFALARSTQPPKFPGPIDLGLAEKGKLVFNVSCAKCHGHYSLDGKILDYPNKIIRMDRIQTDPQRALPEGYAKLLNFMNQSWIGEDFKTPMLAPTGYLAPPLIGIWSTAPYLHNGSVPTLWAMLNSEKRPKYWKVSPRLYDYNLQEVGLIYSEVQDMAVKDRNSNTEKSRYYDTRKEGRGSFGHTFPDALSQDEKLQVLEFLKVL